MSHLSSYSGLSAPVPGEPLIDRYLRDVTLQRYSLLLGRITALSNYISQPPPRPPNLPPSASSSLSTKPALESYLVHPLNPLPTGEAAAQADLSPFAPDVFFQVINTLPLPALSAAQDQLKVTPALRRMDERELDHLEQRLRDRLKRESGRAKSLIMEVERKSAEVDWTMRVDEEEGDEDDGSLFGGGGSEDGDGEGGSDGAGTKLPGESGQDEGTSAPLPAANPREGWTIQDYVRFMETGNSTSTATSTSKSSSTAMAKPETGMEAA